VSFLVALVEASCMAIFEVTGLTKKGGPLTKQISLSEEGKLRSDSSACVMSRGSAQRLQFNSLSKFARHITNLDSSSAIALGALNSELPDAVVVVTKERLRKRGSNAPLVWIARTHEYLNYRQGLPALALIDFDTKGMPQRVKDRIEELGGVLGAIMAVLPGLADAGRVNRRSTSSCMRRKDTDEPVAGSDGRHIYVLVQDGADTERFLHTLHERCWLMGLGWMMLGAGGQLLDRSLVDRTVYAAERLVFEGAPTLTEPLVQDQKRRRAKAVEGPPLDTVTTCPPIRIAEKAKLKELRADETNRLAPERTRARRDFVAKHAKRIAKRTGASIESARHIVERQMEGVLLSGVVLSFDDEEFRGCTVDDVLSNPERFDGATLADPLEGIKYGRCKAKIMRRPDSSIWIHSFAHGRTVYELKFSINVIEAVLANEPDADVIDVFAKLVVDGDISRHELERVRDALSTRTGVNKRTIDQTITAAKAERRAQRVQEDQSRRMAERRDPRPQIPVPFPDDPFLPVVATLNDVLGASTASEPPARDSDGFLVQVRVRRPPKMHTLTALKKSGETPLPAPEHPLLTRVNETTAAELIEDYIDYVDERGRSVHLPSTFVRHFVQRPSDETLPVVNAAATLPIILRDGRILSGRGLDRERGIVFRVPEKLLALLPDASSCASPAIADAMDFLINQWLCDVATGYKEKCILIAIAATIIERIQLPERPAFFISAGQRGGGKTTTLNMIAMTVLGNRAAAAAWSPSEEERRKALLAYLGEGLPLIAWDNIPRGLAISCASIERALTSVMYSDRILGLSESRTVPASAIQVFNGNNISPRGDLASRSLSLRLAVDRPDPENRLFKHPDPIGWTEANRGKILTAIYTILLGNPRLRAVDPPPAETRFKVWFELVGSAIENAARKHTKRDPNAVKIRFRDIFLEGEADDEQSDGLATVLATLGDEFPDGFKAAEVAALINAGDDDAEQDKVDLKGALEEAAGKPIRSVSPTVLNWRLKAIKDAPIDIDGRTMVLRYTADKGGHGGRFRVERIRR
jgi:hypothetical protein